MASSTVEHLQIILAIISSATLIIGTLIGIHFSIKRYLDKRIMEQVDMQLAPIEERIAITETRLTNGLQALIREIDHHHGDN